VPALIKNRGRNSPGIITFTGAEAIWGLPRISSKVREFLNFQSQSGKWIFGVHVQGDLSHLDRWPLEDWIGFVMWPDLNAKFLSNVEPRKRIPLNCVNFMPSELATATSRNRIWDICLISRASSIKRIDDSLEIIRLLINKNPSIKILSIVPDNRRFGDSMDAVDNKYFDLPMKNFSSKQLKHLTFLSSSTEAFGQYPLSDVFTKEIILQSKFVMLNSHSEGTPRSLAEALLLGTPVIVSENLRSGINNVFDGANSVQISDDNSMAAEQILKSLSKYDTFRVDRQKSRVLFSESDNLLNLKEFITGLYPQISDSDGRWHIDNLHLRLACHGQKKNLQFFNRSELFFDWFERVEKICTLDSDIDEDYLSGDDFNDQPSTANSFRRNLILGISKLFRILRIRSGLGS
jgi:glycosyltransferase involved in cell wall biosynthesis